MPAPSDREKRPPLPFEGKQKKKKPVKTAPTPKVESKNSSIQSKTFNRKRKAQSGAIPEIVSNRMIKRIALFSGIPSGLAMLSFVAFYWVVSHDWLEIPNYVVFAVTLLLFGLGVLGLSYGVFSTSWDEDLVGSWWGWQEVKLNFSRTVTAWRNARQEEKKAKES